VRQSGRFTAVKAYARVVLLTALAASVLGASSAVASPAVDDARRLFERAHAALQDLDYETALPLLQKALAAQGLPGKLRASILVDLGVTQGGLGSETLAREDFEHALFVDPAVSPPAGVSPKILELFTEAQAKVVPAPMPLLDAPRPPAAEPPPPVAEVKPVAEAKEESHGPNWTGPSILGGVAALGLGIGIWAALDSNSSASQLRAGLNSQATAGSLLSNQQTMRAVSVTAYSVAGAAAIAGAVYLVMELTGRKATAAAALTTSSLAFRF
jgi:hypothetical protein